MTTQEINVISRTQTIVVDVPSRSVAVISTGLPGPPGAAGADGIAGGDTLWVDEAGLLQPNEETTSPLSTFQVVVDDGTNDSSIMLRANGIESESYTQLFIPASGVLGLEAASAAIVSQLLLVGGDLSYLYLDTGGVATRIYVGSTDPNGVLVAPKGDIYIDIGTPALWQNTDSVDTWVQIGAGGGSGFPVSYDDGTYTFEAKVDGDFLTLQASKNSDPTHDFASVQLDASNSDIDVSTAHTGDTGDLNLSIRRDVNIRSGQSGVAGDINVSPYGSGDINIGGSGGGDVNVGGSGDTGISAGGDVNVSTTSNGDVSVHPDGTGLATIEKGIFRSKAVSASVTGATTVNANVAGVHALTMTGNVTLTLSATTSGEAFSLTLYLIQDGTGGRTVTWPGSVKWAGGVSPVLSQAASAIDVIVLETYDGGTTWFANFAGKGYA